MINQIENEIKELIYYCQVEGYDRLCYLILNKKNNNIISFAPESIMDFEFIDEVHKKTTYFKALLEYVASYQDLRKKEPITIYTVFLETGKLLKNVTFLEISNNTDIPKRTLEDWFSGRRTPNNLLDFLKVLRYLNIPDKYFLERYLNN